MLILVFNRNSNGTNKNFHSVIIYCLLQFQGERMWARDRLWMCMLFFFFLVFTTMVEETVKYMNSCLPFVAFTTKIEEILNMWSHVYKGFFSQVQPSGVTLSVSLQRPRAIICNQHARYKSQTLAAVPSSGHTKIQHTLIGMGSAALAAAVLCLGKVS